MTPQDLAYAVEAVALALEFDRPADTRLSAFFRQHPKLGGRERASIAEAVYGVLRRLRSLGHLAGGDAPPRRLVLAWLARFGGHSLRELEPLVDGSELGWLRGIKGVDLDSLPAAQRLDLPDWLHECLAAQYGDALPKLMEGLNAPAPLDLRINPLKTSRAQALEALRREGLEAEPTPYSPLGLRMRGKPALQRYPLFLDGSLEVQDEGSQLLGLFLGAKRGEMVCDFCAGAGGKSLLLGALMRDTGRLYAFDVSEKRLAKLKPRLARSGLSNIHPQRIGDENDARIKRLAGKLDRVLVDAPCSGLGTLRRSPDMKWRQTPEVVAEFAGKQGAILASAARLLKLGGRLAYATCSLLREENEAVVEAFLAEYPGYAPVPAGRRLAELGIPLDTGPYLRLDPARHGTDGFFAALLERTP